MYRPEGWGENPCDGCARKREDDFGLLCDLACGEYTRYSNFEAGADAIMEALKESATSVTLESNCDIPLICFLSHVFIKMIPGGGLFQKGCLVFIPDEEDE